MSGFVGQRVSAILLFVPAAFPHRPADLGPEPQRLRLLGHAHKPAQKLHVPAVYPLTVAVDEIRRW